MAMALRAARLAVPDALHGERQRDDGGERLARIERGIGILEHRLDACAPARGGRCASTSSPARRIVPRSAASRPSSILRQRRLAGAGFADDAEHLALGDVEVDVGDGVQRAACAERPRLTRKLCETPRASSRAVIDHASWTRSARRSLQVRVRTSAHAVSQESEAGIATGDRPARAMEPVPRNLPTRTRSDRERRSRTCRRSARARCREWRRGARRARRAGDRDRRRAGRACRGGAARANKSAALRGLDDLAGIHHGDPVRDARDDAEVVRDQQERDAELALQIGEQPQDLRLDGDVERGRRLVGDQQRRARTSAPWRSSRAGAVRRTAGADIARAARPPR